MKAIIAGVPGAGKSSICSKLKEKINDLELINYGDLIFNVSKEKFPDKINAREDVRKLPRIVYKEMQIEAAKKINKFKGKIIIDTHLSLKTPYGFYPGLIPETLSIINPDIIILLEFNPMDVIVRREKDRISGKRPSRDFEKEAEILIHQNMNRIYAVNYSANAQSYIKIIDLTWHQEYEFHHVEFAVEEVKKIFRV